jgi:hypothetical protein
MSISRRTFSGSAFALAFATALFDPQAARALASEEAPHDAYEFWNGFFDSVKVGPGHNPGARGGTDGLASPNAETQYLHYKEDEKLLRYAGNIKNEELLDHDGDVVLNIQLSQFRPGTDNEKYRNHQMRIDATQTHAYMNLLAPLAWTAIASLKPTMGGKIPSLDSLGFKSDQATSATSNILLTQGVGKIAVNVSQPPNDSQFLKVLKVMITGARLVAPLVVLPAVSVPAMSAFSEAFGYWEDRTRFVMNGNLTTGVATQQAYKEPERPDQYIGLLNGDYVMVAKQHTDQLSSELPGLEMSQGYLVAKDPKSTKTADQLKDEVLQGVTYATMKIAVKPMNGSCSKTGAADSATSDESSTSPKATKKKKP